MAYKTSLVYMHFASLFYIGCLPSLLYLYWLYHFHPANVILNNTYNVLTMLLYLYYNASIPLENQNLLQHLNQPRMTSVILNNKSKYKIFWTP